MDDYYRTLLHNIRPGNYIVIKVELTTVALQNIFYKNSYEKTTTKRQLLIKIFMILDFKRLKCVPLQSADLIKPLHMKNQVYLMF